MKDNVGVMLLFDGKIRVNSDKCSRSLDVEHEHKSLDVEHEHRLWILAYECHLFCLQLSIRALTNPWFSDLLLRVGDGVEETVHKNLFASQMIW
uniref:Uncharacterized protein n=1 Tax=Lactuca sativa TaxID=4236 RepID=A0A9R1XUK7_LACSA|nr:hypothetical protein LSAT_V11C100048890 [Lactuca sativa]